MKFLIVGESMVDNYYCGTISRLNPEKHSAPLLDCWIRRSYPGGAHNVAENVRALGAQVSFVWQRSGVLIKNRLLDEDSGVIARFDEGREVQPVRPEEIVKVADGCCAVIVSDYGKGAIDQYVVEQIQALDLPTFVDAKVRPDRWVEWAEAMFPNKREYLAHKDDYRQARLCIVKNGRSGAYLISRGMQSTEGFIAHSRAPQNVAGAGDTVTATYSAAYMAMGLDYANAVRQSYPLHVAMAFAGKAVESPFTAALSFSSVYTEISMSDICKKIQIRLSQP